jgi:hypothetical protein
MSYDYYKQEVHLTPGGWVYGTASYNKGEVIARPSDAVQTWLKTLDQSSGYGPPIETWDLTWQSDAVSPEELDNLKSKFPHPRIAGEERIQSELKQNAQFRSWKARKHKGLDE